jgi:hypothetical protein
MAGSPGPFDVDLKVGWLKGRFEDGGVYVRFVESMPGFPLKPRKLGGGSQRRLPEALSRLSGMTYRFRTSIERTRELLV